MTDICPLGYYFSNNIGLSSSSANRPSKLRGPMSLLLPSWTRNDRFRAFVLIAALAALPFLVYSYSLPFPFFCDSSLGYARLSGDTDVYHLEEIRQRPSEFHNIYDLIHPSDTAEHPQLTPWWTSPDMKMIYLRPLSSLSLKLDYLLWGDRPYGYRLTSFFLHGLSCVLLFLIGRQLRMRKAAAFLGGLIFTSHLSTVIVLPWIIDRVSTLSVLFSLLGLFAHIRYRQTGGGKGLFLLSWACFIFAFLSRESGSMCIFSYFFYDVFVWRRTHPGEWPGIVRLGFRYTALCIPFFLFMAYFIAHDYGVVGFYSAFGENRTVGSTAVYIVKNIFLYMNSLLFFAYIANENNTLLFQKAVYFVPFAVMLILAMVMFLPGWKRRVLQDRTNLFLVAWIFSALFPNLYLIPQNRYLYAALAPFGLFMARYLFEVRASRLFGRMSRFTFWGLVIFYGFLATVYVNVDRERMAEAYGTQYRMARETEALVGETPTPAYALFINLPDPLNTFALQHVFDRHFGPDRVRTFPLTVSRTPAGAEILGDHSLRITAGSTPFLRTQYERMFLTEPPERPGYTWTNRYFRATVEDLSEGAIVSIRFDFNFPLDDPSVHLLEYKDGHLRRFHPHGPKARENSNQPGRASDPVCP